MSSPSPRLPGARLILPALIAALCATGAAQAEGDAAKGEKVFKKCAACHSTDPAKGSKAGPNLHDVVGRKSGTYADFKFSPAMTKLGEEGHVWTPEEIEKFVENPKAMVPGTKMTFAGLKKPDERADLVAYLVSLNPAGAEAAAPAGDATGEPASEAAPAEDETAPAN